MLDNEDGYQAGYDDGNHDAILGHRVLELQNKLRYQGLYPDATALDILDELVEVLR